MPNMVQVFLIPHDLYAAGITGAVRCESIAQFDHGPIPLNPTQDMYIWVSAQVAGYGNGGTVALRVLGTSRSITPFKLLYPGQYMNTAW